MQRLGDYTLLSELGRGAMGAVFRARRGDDGPEVALKTIAPAAVIDPQAILRFKREADAGRALLHSNIIKTVAVGEQAGLPFLVMELADGGNLEDLLKNRKLLAEREALQITRDVACGLLHAHERGYIHRDIKPANIMFARLDRPAPLPASFDAAPDRLDCLGRAKIGDFGMVKSLETQACRLTGTGAIVGTPYYISPEQIKGVRDIDHRTDIYSLGATMYRIVTGVVPFSARSPMEVMAKHLKEQLPSPEDLNPGLSAGCATIIRKMMAKNRSDRYATAALLIVDLDRVLEGKDPLNAALATNRSTVRASVKRSGIHVASLQSTSLKIEARNPAEEETWRYAVEAGPAVLRKNASDSLQRAMVVPPTIPAAGATQLRIFCPSCGKKLKAPASRSGQTGLCPFCREPISFSLKGGRWAIEVTQEPTQEALKADAGFFLKDQTAGAPEQPKHDSRNWSEKTHIAALILLFLASLAASFWIVKNL